MPWQTTGNAGTNPTTNFLGTIDAQDLVIRTQDLERMRIREGGHVGIGTTSPSNQFVVADQASFGGDTKNTGTEPVEVQGAGAGVSFYDRIGGATGRWVIYSNRTGGAGTETLRFWSANDKVAITQAGHMGIGTTSPNNQLVNTAQASFGGNTSNTGTEPVEVQGAGAGVSFYDRTGGATGRWVIYSDRTGGAGTETLRFWSANDKAAITQAGHVGIGTTSPNNQLVNTAQASFGGNTSNTGTEPIEVQGAGAGVSFYDRTGGATGRWVIYSDRTGGVGTETLRFWSLGDKVAITQAGQVGIGTTSPNNQLVNTAQASFGGNTSNTGTEPVEVQGAGAGVSFYDRTGGATGRWVIYSDRTGGVGTETLRFWSAGDKVTIDQAGNVSVIGNLSVSGVKSFVQDHPTDLTKEIAYIALEGGEAGTYIRGTAKLVNGKALIELPEHFSLVTDQEGLTIHLTPRNEWLQLYVVELDSRQSVVREAQGKSGEFDYIIHGVREGYKHHQVIRTKM